MRMLRAVWDLRENQCPEILENRRSMLLEQLPVVVQCWRDIASTLWSTKHERTIAGSGLQSFDWPLEVGWMIFWPTKIERTIARSGLQNFNWSPRAAFVIPFRRSCDQNMY